MRKRIFDIIVIVFFAVFLVALSTFGLLNKYANLALIPILVAYYLGQYSEKYFKN
jgi:general stress protein CsbA